MKGFVYFIPGKGRTITPEEIEHAGIGYAIDAGFTPCETIRGPAPDGGGGVVIADAATADGGVKFDPTAQEWRRVPNADAWVGRATGDAIEPRFLRRPTMLDGSFVELGDGRAWLVPAARGWAQNGDGSPPVQFSRLASTARIDDDGAWIDGEVRPELWDLWSLAERWIDTLSDSTEVEHDDGTATVTFKFGELMDGATLALAANYRLGRAEASLLGLLDIPIARRILDALIDLAGLDKILKKKVLLGSSSSTSGERDA